MEQETHVPIEEMDLFRRYVEVADWVWETVGRWSSLAQDTAGKQFIRSIDSVGANLVEGDGRHSANDALHFFVIARASAREARYWLRRAITRKLIPAKDGEVQLSVLTAATQMLNRLIAYRRTQRNSHRVREPQATYHHDGTDPFVVP
jgi:four helix bundle protein